MASPLRRLRSALEARTQAWIRRRQGIDPEPLRLHRGRIYILPTALGLAYATMVFAMVLGALNYGNNLGSASVLLEPGLVTMHHCHGTLPASRSGCRHRIGVAGRDVTACCL
jgi:hypothetical protein